MLRARGVSSARLPRARPFTLLHRPLRTAGYVKYKASENAYYAYYNFAFTDAWIQGEPVTKRCDARGRRARRARGCACTSTPRAAPPLTLAPPASHPVCGSYMHCLYNSSGSITDTGAYVRFQVVSRPGRHWGGWVGGCSGGGGADATANRAMRPQPHATRASSALAPCTLHPPAHPPITPPRHPPARPLQMPASPKPPVITAASRSCANPTEAGVVLTPGPSVSPSPTHMGPGAHSPLPPHPPRHTHSLASR